MQLSLTTKRLKCENLGIGKNFLGIVRKHLILKNSIHRLILDNNYFDMECVTIISKIIKQSNLVQLSLASSNLDSESCKIILHELQYNTYLCDIDFSSKDGLHRNKLGAEGLKPF